MDSVNIKKAIVVGSHGQDGKILCNYLSNKNYVIHEINKSNFNIHDNNCVENIIKTELPNEVYFLAAFHHSSEDILSSDNELFKKSIEINTLALINFLEAIKKYSISTKLFYASSSLIFESNESEKINEKSKVNPSCPYSISKIAAGHVCKMYREKYGVFVSVGILFNHESVHRKPNFVSKKISSTIVEILKGNKNELIIGNINAIVDWGYANDYINAMYLILQLNESNDFVVATGIKQTLKDYLYEAFNHVGLNYLDYVKINPDFLTRKNTVRIGDSTKLKQLTNWEPSVTFSEMIYILINEELTANNLPIKLK